MVFNGVYTPVSRLKQLLGIHSELRLDLVRSHVTLIADTYKLRPRHIHWESNQIINLI